MPKLKPYELNDTKNDPNDMQLFTSKELAEKLKMSEGALATMRIMGTGPKYIKRNMGHGGKVLYDWKDVVAYLESHKCTSTSDMGGKPMSVLDCKIAEITNEAIKQIE